MEDWFITDIKSKLRSLKTFSMLNVLVTVILLLFSIAIWIIWFQYQTFSSPLDSVAIFLFAYLPFPPPMIFQIIILAIFGLIHFLIALGCIVKSGNLRTLICEKESEMTNKLIPRFNNCFCYAIISIIFMLFFDLILSHEISKTYAYIERVTK